MTISKLTDWRWLLLLIALRVHGQEAKPLEAITVKALRPEHFMVGQQLNEADSGAVARSKATTLATFLPMHFPVVMKTYGAGQVASIALRGTSPQHTAVLWNGININFPSLGQSDFSTIPLMGFDRLQVQHGSASSVVGTDAVGGSLLLSSVPQFASTSKALTMGLQAETPQNLSLQGTYSQTILSKNGQRFFTKSVLYSNNWRNQFREVPQQRYPFEPVHTDQKGLLQDVYWLTKKGHLFSFNSWLTDTDARIQPRSPTLQERTQTSAYRFMATYQQHQTTVKAAFTQDNTAYGVGETASPSRTQIGRLLVRIEQDVWAKQRNGNSHQALKLGAESAHFMAQVDGYGNQLIRETRTDLYALFRYDWGSRFRSSVNLRQAFVQGYNPPFTPALGIEYVVHQKASRTISIPLSLARGYRVPTFNERYWQQLGNPNLKPETSRSGEVGLLWKQQQPWAAEASVRLFHNTVDNWVYWNPEKGYRVENLQQVVAKGIEFGLKTTKKMAAVLWSGQLQYALTHTSQQRAFGAYSADILGKQLVYIPRHTVNATLTAHKGSVSGGIQPLLQSARYITFDHSGTAFPPFFLANAWVSYQVKARHSRPVLTLHTYNLTNTQYPSVKKNLMPLRSAALSVQFNILNNKQ